MKRRSYTAQFKEQVVREANEIGNAKQVARRYDISPQLIYKWRKQMETTAASIAKCGRTAGEDVSSVFPACENR
jgi:transposase-like protein